MHSVRIELAKLILGTRITYQATRDAGYCTAVTPETNPETSSNKDQYIMCSCFDFFFITTLSSPMLHLFVMLGKHALVVV